MISGKPAPDGKGLIVNGVRVHCIDGGLQGAAGEQVYRMTFMVFVKGRKYDCVSDIPKETLELAEDQTAFRAKESLAAIGELLKSAGIEV